MLKTRTELKLKKVETIAIERHPVPILGIDYRVKIVYRNIKMAELDVDYTTVKISLPNKYKKDNNKEILDLAINKMYEQIAKVEIENAMEKMRIMLGFAPEDYEVKKINKRNSNFFGKCENRKITIDPSVVKYSRRFIEYIVLREYCHLKYKNHCKGFYEMIAKYEPDYEKYEEYLENI